MARHGSCGCCRARPQLALGQQHPDRVEVGVWAAADGCAHRPEGSADSAASAWVSGPGSGLSVTGRAEWVRWVKESQ
jgi:hypothetical protein